METNELSKAISKIIYIPIRKKVPILYFLLILFVIPIFVFFISSLIEGTLFLGKIRGFIAEDKLDDLGFLENLMRIVVVLVHSIVIFLIVNLARNAPNYLSMMKNSVDKKYISSVDRNIRTYYRLITFKSKVALCWKNFLHILGLLSIAYNWIIYSNDLTGFDFQNYWADKNHPLGLGAWLLYLILTNLICYPICVCYLFSILITIRNIFRDLKQNESYAICLYPYRNGNSDGWKGIKKIVLNLYLIFIPIIIYIFLYMAKLDFDTLFTSGFLIGLAPSVYLIVYPLLKSHYVIKTVKMMEIGYLEVRYNGLFKKFKSKIEKNKDAGNNEIEGLSKSLEYLNNLIKMHRKIPEWPLTLPKIKIAWMAATILSPLITFILDKYVFN